MATFRPTINTCELNFDDKFKYSVPLNENAMRRIANICKEQLNTLKQIEDEDENAIDRAYNLSLDALDEIIGEGAGADIMSIFDNPGLLEIGQVINYIAEEYSEQYRNVFPANKKENPVAMKRGRR